ncbi:helix-turn-helix domain-containing protein [Cupriavidus sp. UYPR2.512]|uniref:helix-turn-helix domain-containing protein n=1 Tax=Cupriavidus sp. UYPR2.512 TaxID=1080187 RepID=UPI00038028B9|nr:helix-turn-helix transcriptional regulator [Cupriavidus sp. UYPR2.512]UIF89964.1 helix-turn-helix transcriptional regulator [Cupriavidus necator]
MASLRQTFAQNLREFRLLRGLSQEEVGEHVGSDRTSVSRIERLAPNLTFEKVVLLSEALDVSPACMLTKDAARITDDIPAFQALVRRLGETIRDQRTAKGLSQQQLGARAGLDRNHISRVETDAARVALDTLEKIVVALGVSIDQIVL